MSAIIERIDTTSLEPLEKATFVELVFTNITPWWGGRHKPRSIACLDNECNKYIFLLPSAQSIKGLLRHILRLAIASFIPKQVLDQEGYVACENFPFVEGVLGRDVIDKRKKLGIPSLLELLFGTVRDTKARQGIVYLDVESSIICQEPYYIDIDFARRVAGTIIRTTEDGSNAIKEFTKNFLSCAESYGNAIFRGDAKSIQKVESECHNYRDLLLGSDKGKLLSQLVAIPRVRLQLQLPSKALDLEVVFERGKGFKDVIKNFIARSIFEIQPLRDKCINVTVRISIAQRDVYIGRKHMRLSEDFISNLKKLLIYALVLGMVVFGIGRAITRGFGKFWLVKAHCYEASDASCAQALNEIRDLLRIDSIDENTILTLVVRINEHLKALAEEYVEAVLREILTLEHRTKILEYPEVAKVPKLYPSQSLMNVKVKNRFRHPCPASMTEIDDKDIAMRFCSKASTGIYIDHVIARGDVDQVLFALAAIGKVCMKVVWKLRLQDPAKLNPREPGFKYHTWCLGLPRTSRGSGRYQDTGYFAIDMSRFAKSPLTKAFILVRNRDMLRRISGACERKELRRWKSPVIFTPLIKNGITKLIVMLLKYNDLGDLINVTTPMKVALETRIKLTHVSAPQGSVRDRFVMEIFQGISAIGMVCIEETQSGQVRVNIVKQIEGDVVLKACECGFKIIDVLLG